MINKLSTTFLLTRVIICAILLVALTLVLKRCDNKKIKEITSEQLKPGENTAVIIDGNSGSVVEITHGPSNGKGIWSPFLRGRKSEPKGNDEQTVTRTDGARGVRISIGKNGAVTVTARTKGFCLEPGIGIYASKDGGRVALDSQLAFYRHHGFNVGLGAGLNRPRHLVGHIAYSYNFYSSTSLFIGVDSNKDIITGVRVRF